VSNLAPTLHDDDDDDDDGVYGLRVEVLRKKERGDQTLFTLKIGEKTSLRVLGCLGFESLQCEVPTLVMCCDHIHSFFLSWCFGFGWN
jgi:hypothetical protein